MKRLAEYDVFGVPVDQVYCDDAFNCRGQFTLESVSDLAESIREHGLQFPIVVQPIEEMPEPRPQGNRYRLLAGYRRFRAVTIFLKWTEIPASIRPGLTDHQARVLNFTENLERRDLNIFEEAKALRNLYPKGVTLTKAAKELKRPTRWVHIRLRLLELPRQVQERAAAGLLSAVNIEAIIQMVLPHNQIKAAEEIASAKKKGKTKFLDPKFKRRFQPRRSKAQINEMITRMLDAGIEGFGPRSLAWAAGYLKDQELLADISAYSQESAEDSPTFPVLGGGGTTHDTGESDGAVADHTDS